MSEIKITSVFKFLIELIFTSKFALEPVRFSEFTFWEEKLMGGGLLAAPTLSSRYAILLTVDGDGVDAFAR